MAVGPRYSVKFRRRREGSTNYKRRFALIKSGKPRLVIRKSNKLIMCQLIEYNESGDKILASANSRELKNLGWKNSLKNLSSAYLTGYKLGLSAKKAKIKDAVLDHGLYDSTKGSKIYAALKGALDAGLKVPCGEGIFPSEERIAGAHINEKVKKDFETLKSKVKE